MTLSPRLECTPAAGKSLMLVSADSGKHPRKDGSSSQRPCPEYLLLEGRHGVSLLGWDGLNTRSRRRSVRHSIQHVATALRQLDGVSVILSDGEHVGIPMALAMRILRLKAGHLMIAHGLGTPVKLFVCRWTGARRRFDRVLVHSPNQVNLLAKKLAMPRDVFRVVPYGVDTAFWHPLPVREEPLVVSPGREHRDFQTLVDAWGGQGRIFVTDASAHSPNTRRRGPVAWPETVERRALTPVELREMYARASVVVVPVVPTAFPFGITALLEAMAMGKAVVASDTDGLRPYVDDGETGILVPPGDAMALQTAIERLRADPDERARLGRAARKIAVERYSLDAFAAELARHMDELQERWAAEVGGR